MKSTKVQTLGAVVLHATTMDTIATIRSYSIYATTDCRDDASIVGLGPLNWAIV